MAKRRGNGEGSVYPVKDKDGKIIKWRGSVELGIKGGKRDRKYLTGKRRVDVARQIAELEGQRQRGIVIDTDRTNLNQYLPDWIELMKTKLAPRTYKGYKSNITNHILPALGKARVTKLGSQEIDQFLNQLRTDKNLAPCTVANIHNTLRSALEYLVTSGKLQRNPASFVSAPRDVQRKIMPLSLEQALILLEAVKGHALEVLYRVALSLGLRRGEVCGLTWADVDFKRGTLTINGSLQRYDGELHRDDPKTEASQATLTLGPVLIEALRQHRARQEADRKKAIEKGKRWVDTNYVFTSRVGTSLEPHNVNRHFKIALEKAKLPTDTHFHDLRHSCATMLIAQGEHPRVIMDILRHTKIDVTMNIYGHVFEATQRAATSKLDATLGGV